MKLPAVRGQLQILAARSRKLDDLFEAYDDAASALDRFQRSNDTQLVAEYHRVCCEIEADIIQHVLRYPRHVQD